MFCKDLQQNYIAKRKGCQAPQVSIYAYYVIKL